MEANIKYGLCKTKKHYFEPKKCITNVFPVLDRGRWSCELS